MCPDKKARKLTVTEVRFRAFGYETDETRERNVLKFLELLSSSNGIISFDFVTLLQAFNEEGMS